MPERALDWRWPTVTRLAHLILLDIFEAGATRLGRGELSKYMSGEHCE